MEKELGKNSFYLILLFICKTAHHSWEIWKTHQIETRFFYFHYKILHYIKQQRHTKKPWKRLKSLDSRCGLFFIFLALFLFRPLKCASCFKRFTAKNMKHLQVIEYLFFGCHKGKQSWIYFFFLFFFYFFSLGKRSFPKNIPSHIHTGAHSPHMHVHTRTRKYTPHKDTTSLINDLQSTFQT